MRKRAFTAIEALVLLAIFAVLVAMIYPLFAPSNGTAKMSPSRSTSSSIGDYEVAISYNGWASGGGRTYQFKNRKTGQTTTVFENVSGRMIEIH